MNNELYWNSYANGVWSGWVDLQGASASAPVLVSIPALYRIDLFVQGMDNGIYHKAYISTHGYTSGVWSSSWDSPGGATLNKPAAAFHEQVLACESIGCHEYDWVELDVRGTDNRIYDNQYIVSSPYPNQLGWHGWSCPGSTCGTTLSAPTLAPFDNGCEVGATNDCYSLVALAVRGTDNAVYHTTYSENYWTPWDSAGGSISNSPALAYNLNGLDWYSQFVLLVEGGGNNLYSNTVTTGCVASQYSCSHGGTGGPTGTWAGYSSVGGATNSDPAFVTLYPSYQS
jgi:hypothetical protein